MIFEYTNFQQLLSDVKNRQETVYPADLIIDLKIGFRLRESQDLFLIKLKDFKKSIIEIKQKDLNFANLLIESLATQTGRIALAKSLSK